MRNRLPGLTIWVLAVLLIGWAATVFGANCTYTLSPSSRIHPWTSEATNFTVIAEPGCDWTVSTTNDWLLIKLTTNGTGTDIVRYTVVLNEIPLPRTGYLTVNGVSFEVMQEASPCTYTLLPPNRLFGAEGGSSTLGILTADQCEWSLNNTSHWITFTAATSGSGNSTLEYAVAPNVTTRERQGVVRVSDQAFVVSQLASPCSYTISVSNRAHTRVAATSTVSVATSSNCASTVWSVVNTSSWIRIVAGSNGMGNGTVRYGITANTNGTPRTATLFIADNAFRIEQAGVPCTFSLASSSRSHTYLAATGTLNVTALLRDCPWNVVNTSAWITVTSPPDSAGSGVFAYQLQLNTGPERQGRVRIGNATFTITQDEADPVEIETEPVGRGVLPGATVTFSVEAIGTLPLAYQWQFNGSDLEESANVRGTRTPMLTLVNVQPSQSGNYSAVVSNLRGPVTSAPAQLRVNTPPVIEPISDRMVNRGTPLAAAIVTRDQDVPVQTLTYTLTDAPAGATINAASGLFTWTPSSSQNPSTNRVVVKVVDNGSPSLSSTSAFKVVVLPGTSTNLAFINTNSVWKYRDTGEDLGSAWRAREYDDSAWRSGRGVLGYGSSGMSTTVSYGPSSSAKHITTYFRHHFSVADPASVTALNLRVRRDDGVIVYLNGREAYRNNMPVTAVNYLTRATADGTSSYVTSPAAPDLLLPGENVIAAEIHQRSPSSSDIAFDLGLTATVSLNKPSIITQPESQTIFEGENALFTVAANGITPLRYQWYFEGTPLAVATNTTLALSGVTMAQGGGYFAVITNPLGSATSAVAILTVLAITNEPPLLTSIGDYTVEEGSTLTFVAAATDPNGAGEQLTFSFGAGPPPGATIGAMDGVFRWTPTPAQGPSSYRVTIRVADNGRPQREDSETITITVREVNSPPVLGAIGSRAVNEGATLQLAVTATDVDLPAQALQFSLEPGAPPGANINPQSGVFSWTPTETDGPGSYSATILVTDSGSPRLSDSETILITVNEVNNAPVLAAIGNHNIPQGGSLRFTATASDSDDPVQQLSFSLDAGAPSGAAIDPATGLFTWTPTLSQTPSTNRVTLRVSDNGSPVLSDSEAITVTVVAAPTTNVTLISTGAVWSFRDTGEDLGTSWTSPLYDDSGWRIGSGPLGYGTSGLRTTVSFGPSSSAKHITTYFRHQFNIGDPGAFSALNMRLRRDDGVVVYLNGIEVYRNNMPTGPIDYRTEATTSASSASSYLSVPLDPALLTSEVNVIAASIHQESPSSSDIQFDLELTGRQTLSSLSIVSHPRSQTASRGANVSLSVSTIGIQPLRYQWYFAGTLLAGATNATLSLPNVQETQTGDYFAVVSNVSGSLTSAVARLTVSTTANTPPVISTIGPKTIAEGNLLTFTAVANDSGVPPQTLSYSLENAPAGATINPVNGVFSWTPTEAQGPSSNVVTVRVSDDGSPQLSDTQAVSIVVTEVNTAPAIVPISDKRVAPGTPVSFPVQATDADLPAQTLTFSLAPGAPSGATIDAASGFFSFTPGQVGTNTISVRVRDDALPPLSNAISFSIVAAAVGSQSNVVLIPTLSTWKYRDTGEDLGTAWTLNSFNDSAWSSGRGILGYGNSDVTTEVEEGSSSRFVTTYFRSRFNIADPAPFTSLRLRVLRDDGVVVYLNGLEIHRDNMPAGPINYLTTAPLNMDSDDETTYFPSPVLSPAFLRAGENVVAVEIHQKSVGSSDITFDLELTGMMSTDLPSILSHPVSMIVLQGEQATFSVTARNATAYQWHLNGVAIPNATNATLVIPNAQAAHAGRYHAMALNNSGTASSRPAELQVDQPNSVRFVVGNTSGGQGAHVDVPIRVQRFRDILSVQFSLHWDSTVARFVAVDQLGLVGLTLGTTQTANGTVTASWDDGASVPRTLADNAVLFVLRLELIGPAGNVSNVSIDGNPTAMEVADSHLHVLPSHATAGELRIDPAAAPITQLPGPALSISITSDGQVSLQWNATPGAVYRLQASPDLSQDSWIDLGELTSAGDTASATDTVAETGQRFYRVLLVE